MIEAPLCSRCAKLLAKDLILGKLKKGDDVCPWCQRNRADYVYIIQIPREKQS